MLSLDSPEVAENGSSIFWHTMVRPRGEVILCHFARGTTLTGMLIYKNKIRLITMTRNLVCMYYNIIIILLIKDINSENSS